MPKLLTNLLIKQLLPSLTIVSLLAPQFTYALDTGLRESQQGLQQEHKEEEGDKSPCQADEMGANGLIQQASNSLSRSISNGLRQSFSQTISQSISQNLQRIVQRQLSQNLPRLIETELSQQLPSLLRQKLQRYPSNEWNDHAPSAMQESVRELLPNIIRGGLPSMLRQGIGTDLRSTMANDFSSQVPGILGQNEWFQNATSQLISGLLGLLGPLASLLPNNPLLGGVRSGIANDAGNGIINSSAIDRIIAQIMPVIMRVVLEGVQGGGPGQQGLLAQMSGNNLSAIVDNFGRSGGFESASSGFNFNDFAGNNITAAIGFDLAPVSQAIAHPLALSIVSGLGVSGYDGAIGNLGAIGYSGPINVSVVQAAAGFDSTGVDYAQRLGGYNGPLTTSAVGALNAGNLAGDFSQFPSPLNDSFVPPSLQELSDADFLAANPEFVGPPAPIDSLGTDAAGAVDGTRIANNSVNSLGLGDQISQSLKGGLANGISGGIGNLVDGIPYVGGFISPIAEEITNMVLMEALGIGADASGLPTNDVGQHHVTADGFKNTIKSLGKPLNKIDQATKTSNKNEENIIKNQTRQESVAVKDCLKNKSSLFTLKNLETLFRAYNPAAWASSMVLTAAALKNFKKFTTNAVPDRFNPNGEGRTTTANLEQNKTDAKIEAARQAGYDIAKSGDQSDIQRGKRIAAMAEGGLSQSGGLSRSDIERFENDDQRAQLSPAEYVRIASQYQGTYDPVSRDEKALFRYLALADEKTRNEEVKQIANQGVNDITKCRDQLTDPNNQKFCGFWDVLTRGGVTAARENLFATADILKLIAAHNYKEDSVGPLGRLVEMFNADSSADPNSFTLSDENPCPGLEPCNPGQQYQQGGYDITNYGLIDQFSFDSNFSNALNQALTQGANNLTGWSESQINSFTSNLGSGWNSYGFSYGDFRNDNGCNYACQSNVTSLITANSGGSLSNDGLAWLVQKVIAVAIEIARQGQNQTR